MQKKLIAIIWGLLMITLVAVNLPSPMISYDSAVAYAMGPSFNPDSHHGDKDRDKNRDKDKSRPAAPVPEPSTLLLLGAGLAGVGLLRKKFKK